MPLNAIVETIDELPEVLREHYVERDGKYHLSVNGMKTDADIARVQKALNSERETAKSLKAKLDQYTPLGDLEEIQTRLDRIAELEALAGNGKLDDSKINDLVEARLKAKLTPVEREKLKLQTQLSELTNEITSLRTEKQARLIEESVRKAATKLKLRPEAVEDAIMYGKVNLKIESDGSITTSEGLLAEVWLEDFSKSRPHWFPESVGGGSRGSSGPGGVGVNPWAKDTFNLTEQGRITREEPKRAEQLKRLAGVK